MFLIFNGRTIAMKLTKNKANKLHYDWNQMRLIYVIFKIYLGVRSWNWWKALLVRSIQFRY